jgi:dTMP kinase
MPGLFITFEGTEGAGKSTQIELLRGWLEQQNWRVTTVREPGGTALGEEIRALLKHSPAGRNMVPAAELLLFNASRAQLIAEVIQPHLQSGGAVLCDRFFDSTLAYQVHGRGLPEHAVRQVIEFATGGLEPDLTFLLQLSLEQSELRRRSRDAQLPSAPLDRFEQSQREFFQRVEAGYAQLIAAAPSRLRVVEAHQEIESVHQEIVRHLRDYLAKKTNQGVDKSI